jgi:hypothetical protein
MLYSAFVIGFAGSLHCLGMCGPIALALPVPAGNRWVKLTGRVLYNAGRIFTYAALGLLLGWFGQSLSLVLSQQHLSIAIGTVMLGLILLPLQITQKLNVFAPVARLTGQLKKQFAVLFGQRSLTSLFLLGVLNGLLPCGTVYIALAGAVATGSGWLGTGYMALFGVGTLPVMLSVSLSGQWMNVKWRSQLSKVLPAFTLAVAVLLILRGLDLGIPGVSPHAKIVHGTIKAACCHKQ